MFFDGRSMNSLSPAVQLFLLRGLFSASIVYLAVAVFILQPSGWFGLVHLGWAVVCVVASWRAFRAAKRRFDEPSKPKSAPQ